MNAAAGDWVRFQQIDTLVIGVVQYVRVLRKSPWEEEAVTDKGNVRLDDILEVRYPSTPQTDTAK